MVANLRAPVKRISNYRTADSDVGVEVRHVDPAKAPSQILRKGCELKVLARCLVEGFDGLCKVLEAVQEFFERHAVFVIDLREGERFTEPVVHHAILMRVEVSNLQDLLDLLDARRIEHVQ